MRRGRAVDEACLIEDNYRSFTADGTLPAGATRVLDRTDRFDHCSFTVVDSAPADAVARSPTCCMSDEDPELRPLLALERLRRWVPARARGYQAIEKAVDEAGFYDDHGAITAAGYVYQSTAH